MQLEKAQSKVKMLKRASEENEDEATRAQSKCKKLQRELEEQIENCDSLQRQQTAAGFGDR